MRKYGLFVRIFRTNVFLLCLVSGLKTPKQKGERLIILHIGSKDGFVEEASLVFKSKKNTADYHDEMNGDHFEEWLGKTLPKLKENSVIVMDNAPYHSVKQELVPNMGWRKEKIQEWLLKKDIYFGETYTKRELIKVVASFKPEVQFRVDEMAKAGGHEVLRLPPYHCELNPIEMVWSEVKRYVASNNTTFKLKDVEGLVHDAFQRVTPEKWKNYEEHVVKEEEKFCELENIQDEVLDRFIISLADDDDETSVDEDEIDEPNPIQWDD